MKTSLDGKLSRV